MTTEEKLLALDDAQEKLYEAIEIVEKIFADDNYVKAYFIDHLKIRAGDGHGFLSDDLNLDKLKQRIEDGEEKEI